MNDTGTVGVGIAPNGDIVAVFKNKDGGPPRALDTMMPIAIEQGGNRLDCYGEGLVRTYENYGFIPVARVEFNPEYANDGWTPDKGTPYIYFMMHNGDSADQVASNIRKYPHATQAQLDALPTYGKDDYDAAMAYRDSLMEKKSQGHPPTSVGAAPADFTGKSAFNDLLSDENAQPDRPDDVRPMEIPKTDAYGRHVSETAANLYGAEVTPDHAADMVQELVAEGALGFDTKTNAQLLSQAAEEIKKDGLGASEKKVNKAVFNGKYQDSDIAKAVMLYTLYANKNTDASQEKAAELMVDLCTMANDAGRKLQLFKLIRRMTPAGQLLAVEKGINQAVDRINSRRSKKNQASVQIPQSLKNEYLAAAAKDMELQTTESAKAKEDAEQAMYKIAASQIKGSLMEKLNAWRYMSMLCNVKTQLRNVGGNLAFRPMVNTKRALGAVLESIALDKEKRTKSILGVGPKSQALLKWAKEDANTQTARNMLSYCAQTGDTARNAIEDNRQIYDHQWLENVRKFVQAVPEAADMVFKCWEYSVSLASFMKARGYTADDLSAGTVPDHVLNEGRSYAAQEALKATFNDLNTFSNLMTKLRYNGDNSFMKAISALGEGVMPFRRTPANIAVRALEYSPVNLLKSVTWNVAKLKSGEMTGAQFIDQIAAGATGTGAAVLGWLLASGLLGIRLRGRVDDEDEKNAGHQSYSIEIGGKSFTVDWLAPTNIPFFMGANFYETGQATDADWFSTFLQSSVGTFEPMLELSCLSSVNDLLETVQYSQGEPWWAIATSAATSYLNQYLPTLFGQIEQATESEKKIPYSDASTPFGRTVERFIGKATQKIPGIDLFQAEKYDSRGNPEKTTGWGEALLSPSYASEISDDPVDQEIARLNQAQSTNVSFPSPPKTLSYTDSSGTYHEDYRLSASEYETMGRVQGQTQYQLLSQLMKSEDYAALSDKEKATAVESVYKYAKEKAAIETFPDHAGFSSAWMSGVEEQGADVILHKTVESSFDSAFTALTKSWSSGWSDDAALTELEDAYTTFSALPDNTRTAIKNALTGRCTAYVAARESGMSTDTFSELYRQYRQISDTDLSPSAKAQKWAHVLEQSVERHQISTSQRDLMKEELGFAAITSQDSEGYDKMLAAGVSSDSADLISDILRDIMPEDGHSSVRPIQKLEAIAESDELTDEELERILPLYMSSDSTRQRYDMALDKGFSSEEFVVAYRIYLDKDGETKTQLIRQMANELDIPYTLARQLYEIHSQRLSNE